MVEELAGKEGVAGMGGEGQREGREQGLPWTGREGEGQGRGNEEKAWATMNTSAINTFLHLPLPPARIPCRKGSHNAAPRYQEGNTHNHYLKDDSATLAHHKSHPTQNTGPDPRPSWRGACIVHEEVRARTGRDEVPLLTSHTPVATHLPGTKETGIN